MKGLYRDVDALAYHSGGHADDKAKVNHVGKRNKTAKGLEVTFDDADRKEYLTGFRKRKLARRKETLKKMEQKQREDHRQYRAENRQQFKTRLGLPDNYGLDDSDDDKKAARAAAPATQNPGDVKVYDFGEVTTTVTTIAMDSDAEPEQGSDESDGDADVEPAAAGQQPQQQQADAADQADKPAKSKPVNQKALANLKARIAGKKMKRKGQKSDKGGGGKGGGKGKGGKGGKGKFGKKR